MASGIRFDDGEYISDDVLRKAGYVPQVDADRARKEGEKAGERRAEKAFEKAKKVKEQDEKRKKLLEPTPKASCWIMNVNSGAREWWIWDYNSKELVNTRETPGKQGTDGPPDGWVWIPDRRTWVRP